MTGKREDEAVRPEARAASAAPAFTAEFAERHGTGFTDDGQRALAALLRWHGIDSPERVDEDR